MAEEGSRWLKVPHSAPQFAATDQRGNPAVSFTSAFRSASSRRGLDCSTDPESNVGWRALVGVVLLALVGLTGFAIVKHLLFPSLSAWEYQAITIGVGAVAAGVSAYYVMRKMGRLVAMHAQMEARLVLERNVLRTVTDNIHDSIFAKDTAGRYLLANKAFANLHGMKSTEELLGKTAFDLFSEDRATSSHADDLKVMRTGGAVLERERSTVDSEGNEKWVLTTKVPLISKDGLIQGIVGVHRDITRSKQAEQRLRESQASLATAQRIAHLGSFEVGPINLNKFEDSPLRWSDEVFRNFGYEFDGTELSVGSLLRLVHPDDRGRVSEGFLKTFQQTTPYEADYRIVRADGTERFVRGWCEVVCDSSTQQPSKLAGSIQDVTDRKQAELGLQGANRTLGEQVQELKRRSNELALLSEMGGWLQSCRVVDEAYAVIGRTAKRLFPGWNGALYVMSASKNALEAVVDWNECSSGERVFGPDECWALRRGQLHRFRAEGDGTPCSHINREGIAESFCVPLMAQGEALGILFLQQPVAPLRLHDSDATPADANQGLAVVLAEQIALALGNLKLRETLRNQSIRDPLTSLFNRRYLEESLEREISRARRNGSLVAVLMTDIDHFKRFNDTYGHQAGDAVLRALGEYLNNTTRGQDVVCRYGGEEFALMLSDADQEGALHRAEVLRREVKYLNAEYQGQHLGPISLSVGLALFPDHGSAIGDLLRAADQALYCAKREGRDRVYLWMSKTIA